MSELLLAFFREKYDPNNRVQILRSSKDPGLAEYLDWAGLGSTHMEEDGKVYVKIHDAGGATRGTWLEEFGHALQFLKSGQIELSVDDEDRRHHEIEIATCLVENSLRLDLSEADVRHCQDSITFYGGGDL